MLTSSRKTLYNRNPIDARKRRRDTKDKTMVMRLIRRTCQALFPVGLFAVFCALAATAWIEASIAPAAAQAVDEFYKGKTITIADGFSPGGSYDFYPRLFSRYMSKHILGNP